MKTLLLFLAIATNAYAAPVLNNNMAAEGTFVTIWPDHADPDHFYFAPNFMKIASDDKKNPKFHLTQYRSGNCGRISQRLGKCQYKALLTSMMIAGYEHEQLLQAEAGIKKLRPKARFSAIPFMSSKVEFGNTMVEFIDQHECSPKTGQAADEIPCTLTLNRRGINYLMPFLNSGRILPFKFIYQITGVVQEANGQYKNESLDYGLTVNLGGDDLIKHPELDSPFPWE
jgi:hypothetical protein